MLPKKNYFYLIIISLFILSISQNSNNPEESQGKATSSIILRELYYLGSEHLNSHSNVFILLSYLYIDLTKIPDNKQTYFFFLIQYDYYSSLKSIRYQYTDNKEIPSNFNSIEAYSTSSSSTSFNQYYEKNYKIKKPKENKNFLFLEITFSGVIDITNTKKEDKSEKTILIISIVVTVVFFIIILIVTIVCCIRMKKKNVTIHNEYVIGTVPVTTENGRYANTGLYPGSYPQGPNAQRNGQIVQNAQYAQIQSDQRFQEQRQIPGQPQQYQQNSPYIDQQNVNVGPSDPGVPHILTI